MSDSTGTENSAPGGMRSRYEVRRKLAVNYALVTPRSAKLTKFFEENESRSMPVDSGGDGGRVPRRHPASARVSAVRNYPDGFGNNSTKDTERNKRRKRGKEAQEDLEEKEVDIVGARGRVKKAISEFVKLYMEMSVSNPQADIQAWKIFKEKKKDLIGSRCVGSVPGVEVGDEFVLRVEMCIAGVHCQHRQPFDFIYQDGKAVAVSLVYTRSYAEGVLGCDLFDYPSNGNLKIHWNLALKNSMDTRTPVRVIYGFEGYQSSSLREINGSQGIKKKKNNITYVYDGVFLVDKYWSWKGSHKKNVCMFQLKRLSSQAELDMKIFKTMEVEFDKHLVMKDISGGDEKIPIPVVNAISDELPKPFKYTKAMICPPNLNAPPPRGCDCVGACSDSGRCACARKNGGELPFNELGEIVEAKPLIYECGPSCKCPPSCHNRVLQNGIKLRLEVFKTEMRGWGVRSREPIPQGSFICEYAGTLLDDHVADFNANDEYLFDIGENLYDKTLWEGLKTSIPDLENDLPCKDDVLGYAVDALEYGNVGRFVNHSCTPNLFAQNLLFDHDNKKMPHIALFAQDDIKPMEELTYDYNYAIEKVRDSAGNIKKKNCYCGTKDCTGRLY